MSRAPRLLHGHPTSTPAESFEELAAYCREHGVDPDVYGKGEWLQVLEREIAVLLGHESALFFPSGTMAQQIVLRIWAHRRSTSWVAFHATSHVEVHEQQAYRHLHGLEAHLVGEPLRVPTAQDVERLPADTGALLIELPMREIGGQLLPRGELDRIRTLTRERDIALHLDGARLYEAATGYGTSPREIAREFDSVYVSFYKGIGGLAGAALAGPEDFIEEARVWLRRHGGNLVQMTPFTVAAKIGLERHLDRFPAYLRRAREIEQLLSGRYPAPGVRSGEMSGGEEVGLSLVPTPVQVNMVHLLVDATPEEVNERREEAGRITGLLPTRPFRTDRWGRGTMTELYIGESALRESDETIRASFDVLLGRHT
jgi:threonine aldolase